MACWAGDGVVGQIRDQLRKRIRREMGRSPGAVATVIDSQSFKAAETVGRDSRGYDSAKKINGRKRHFVVDTKGLPLFAMVTPADMTDRDAAKEVLFRLRLMHPEITIAWADPGYAGQLVTWAKKHLGLTLKTVSQPKNTTGFVILAPPLGGRTVPRPDHARTPPRERLRTPDPALAVVDHLGRDHLDDQANHPSFLPPKRPARLPRSEPGLIPTARLVSPATFTPRKLPGPPRRPGSPLLCWYSRVGRSTAPSDPSTSVVVLIRARRECPWPESGQEVRR
ncbi:transposase [Streptomyces microflavus]|uniref:transposase n=1 Tax=Streptomyces microflavus TaxID=1919 RepID=UPI0037AEADCB